MPEAPSYPVLIDRRVFVTMADGVRIGVTVYLPDAEGDGPFPVVVESVPYRKDEDCFGPDWRTYAYFAQKGIAGVRIDVRGTGASEGVAANEYTPQEMADTLEILRWAAAQDWCNGNVGMWGISWGGFSSLQAAMARPPELKAIVAAHATHDRFASDVHYVGGSLHAAEQADWPGTMVAYNGLPPDPEIVGERWAEMWMERLELTPQWPFEWLRHQRRDDYWLHGSPCADYGSIEAATLLIGGWLDGYVDGMLALLESLDCPKRAVIGPWGHFRPANGVPAPTLDHLDLMARWFGHHLRGDDNGVMDMPALTAWIRTEAPYDGPRSEGYWRAEPSWPPADGITEEFPLSGMSHEGPLRWRGPQWVGSHAPFWDRAGLGSTDSAADDAASLVFETAPLSTSIDLLGPPEVDLHVTVDEPVGMVAVRLLVVSPAGDAHLLCRGNRNLVFPEDLSDPVPIEPGVGRQVRFPLLASSAVVPQGWRLRLAIAGADFPVVFPPPRRFALTIDPNRSTLILPLVPPRPPSATLDIGESPPPPEPPVIAVSNDLVWSVTRSDGSTVYQKRVSDVEKLPERNDLVVESTLAWSVSVTEDDPNATRVRFDGRVGYDRPGWSVETLASLQLTTDGESFDLAVELAAFHDKKQIWERRWQESIAREWA
jgi:putative CocE/NonD family hydrolase